VTQTLSINYNIGPSLYRTLHSSFAIKQPHPPPLFNNLEFSSLLFYKMMSFDTACAVPGQKPPSAAALDIQTVANGTSHNTESHSATAAGQAGTHTHIWLVTGPAGCGKSSVAEYLANALDMPYIEGDSVCRQYLSLVRR
jgi:hypothetical protein